MVKFIALTAFVKIFTLLSLVQSPKLLSAFPTIRFGSLAGANTKAPPNWPLNSAWPTVLLCNSEGITLDSYRADIKTAEYAGTTQNIPHWQITLHRRAGATKFKVNIYFRAEAGNLIFGPRADWELEATKTGLTSPTGGVSLVAVF